MQFNWTKLVKGISAYAHSLACIVFTYAYMHILTIVMPPRMRFYELRSRFHSSMGDGGKVQTRCGPLIPSQTVSGSVIPVGCVILY